MSLYSKIQSLIAVISQNFTRISTALSRKIDTPSTASSGQVLTYNGSAWVASTPSGGASVYISDTEPSSPTDGMLWIDTVDDTLDGVITNGINLSY